MYPVLPLDLFGASIQLRSYVLFTVLGALVGVLAALPLLRREGLASRRAIILMLYMTGAFLVGARLFNFAVNSAAYGQSLHIYSMRLAGLSVYGGILGALGALLIWSRLVHVRAWPLLDALVLPSGLGFALARVGCYLNGCCVGIATNSVWGMAFPSQGNGQAVLSSFLSLLGKDNITVCLYPTQLFEMGLALVGLFPVMWLYLRKRLPVGAAFVIYGIWFSTMRLMILPLRAQPYPDIVRTLIYPLFYVALILIGLFLLRRLYKKYPTQYSTAPAFQIGTKGS